MAEPTVLLEARSPRRMLLLPIAALAVLDLILFADLLAIHGGAVPMGGDVETHGRLIEFAVTHLRRGEFPLWNPHVFSGMPALGDPNAMMLYPLTLLGVVFPLPLAITVMTACHVLLLGASFHVWMARHQLHPLACLLAAAMVSLGAPFFARIYAGHLSALVAMAWAPLFLLAIEELVEAPTGRWVAVGAVSLAMQALGGHVQFVLYTLTLAVGLVLLRAYRGHLHRRAVPALALTLALGVGVAAAQLVAVAAATLEGTRSGRLTYPFVAKFSMPWSGLLTILVPGFFGQLSDTRYWGSWLYWEVTPYVGVVGLALAIQGALYGSPGQRRVAAVGAVAFLLLALGGNTPLLRVLYGLGMPFDRFRCPGRALFPFSLFAAMLAAVGLDGLMRNRSPSRALVGLLVSAAIVLLLFAASIRLASRGDVTGIRSGIERILAATPDRRHQETERLVGSDHAWAERIWGLGDAFDELARAQNEQDYLDKRRRYKAALVAATTVNRWQALRSWMVDPNTLGMPIEEWTDPTAAQRQAIAAATSAVVAAMTCALTAMLLWWAGRSERAALVLGVVGVLELLTFAWTARGTFDLSRTALQPLETFYRERPGDYRVHNPTLPNTAMSLGIRDIWGLNSILPARYASYMIFTQRSAATEAGAPFLNLQRVHPSYRMLRLQYVLRQDDDTVRVLRDPRTLPAPLPHLLLLRDYVVREGQEQIFATLDSPSWNPATTVTLESEPHPTPAAGGEGGQIRLLEETTDRMTIEADLPSAALLLVTDAYSSGWRARPLPGSIQHAYDVLPANYVLRAVPLSAGHHLFELSYAPPHLRLGVIISGLALCGVAALGFMGSGTRCRASAGTHA